MKQKNQMVALFMSVFSVVAYAGPSDKVFTPGIGVGESEMGVKYGSASPVAGRHMQVTSVGYGYGVWDNWFTEVSLKQARGVQSATLVEWENKFLLTEPEASPLKIGLLTEPEASPLKIGLLTELEMPVSGNAAKEVRFGPLFQAGFGRWQLNGNVLFERAFGGVDENGVPFCTNLAYQWQIKYHWHEELELGMQGFGEVGKWNNWSRQPAQNHRVGPAVFGEFDLDAGHALKYSAAWLFGTTAASPNHAFRMNFEYEF